MDIDAGCRGLKAILTPPVSPLATGSPEQWANLESRLGFRLPQDCKWFISTYGYGSIDDAVVVYSPFTDSAYNLEQRIAEHRAAHVVAIEYQEEPEGLIPWAGNAERGVCHWVTDDPNPDAWTVDTSLDDDTHRFPENMTTFLVRVLRGNQISSVFGGLFHRFRLPVKYEAWH